MQTSSAPARHLPIRKDWLAATQEPALEPDRPIIDPNHRQDNLAGRGQKSFPGGIGLLRGKRAFFQLKPFSLDHLDEDGSGDTP